MAGEVPARVAAAGDGVSRAHRLRLAKGVWRAAGAVGEDRVRLEFIRVADRIGRADQTAPKVLRHQFATALQEGRVDPRVRNLPMGHAAAEGRSAGHGLGMTAVYTHSRPETVRGQLEQALRARPVMDVVRAWLSCPPVNPEPDTDGIGV